MVLFLDIWLHADDIFNVLYLFFTTQVGHLIKSYHSLACMFFDRHNLSFTCIGRFTRVCNIGQMWGAPRRRHQVFHIPLTDHGCKCTQVHNNSESLAHTAKFSREVTRPARLYPDWNVLLPFIVLRRSLLDWPVNRSNWSDSVGGCFQLHE